MEVLHNNWNSEGKAYDGEDERYKCKELERTIVFKERSNHCDDLDAVADRVEFGFRAGRSISILYRHVLNAPAVVDGMDGELGFDLKALAQDGERLDEGFAHGSIAGHHVVKSCNRISI